MSSKESRFASYVERLSGAVGHADRAAPLKGYCTGLLLDGERKSVEPMAARVAPRRVSSTHQSLHHFVAAAGWSDAAVLSVVREWALPAVTQAGDGSPAGLLAWIVDDTGIVKKGRHSVGVGRQYCGAVGKTENCQVAVSLTVASGWASLPIAYRLYLPEAWAEDAGRRRLAGVPADVVFMTKPEIALKQIRQAVAEGLPRGVVLADAAYGNDTAFRDAVSGLGLRYAVGVQPTTTVWAPGTAPLAATAGSGRGRPASRLRRDAAHQPVAVRALALALPASAYHRVTWRQGTNGRLSSRFAACRVRPAHRDTLRSAPRPEEWLLIEWPKGESEPTKYWLATLPADMTLKDLVLRAKMRWRIERDYEELKQELGLGHYEGRGWRGFHHHATLCFAAYGFLIAERAAIPPSAPPWRPKAPRLPKGWRPRGSAAAPRTAQPRLDRQPAPPPRRHPRRPGAALPLLPAHTPSGGAETVNGYITQ
jgi:SRSO17 transposase